MKYNNLWKTQLRWDEWKYFLYWKKTKQWWKGECKIYLTELKKGQPQQLSDNDKDYT